MNQFNRIVLAGGTGFLGKLLYGYFSTAGCDVLVLTRSPRAGYEVPWDGRSLGPWAAQLEGAGVLLNLAGKSVNCRYNERNRKLIMDSRVESTRVLGEAVAKCKNPPAVWLNASTATIYRHSLDRDQDENSRDFSPTAEVKDAFSVSVTAAWEEAFAAAVAPKTRKVALRISMVLGTEPGSVFRVLLRLARLGLGGRMASGKQYVSWIHERDFCRAIEWLIATESISGQVNMTAPHPIPNAGMMRVLRRSSHMPIGLPATAWMLEAGAFFMRTETELILKSRRVVPRRLLDSGFNFLFPRFEDAAPDLMAKLRALAK
jgi:uncharacterized protein (TIGR01777 family)